MRNRISQGQRRKGGTVGRSVIGSVGAIAVAVAISLGGTGIASAAPVPVMADGGLQEALLNFAAAPNSVRGANDSTCKPNKTHPNPVILPHGTLLNAGANFVRLAPPGVPVIARTRSTSG